MRVALCQFEIAFEKKEENTRRAIDFMEQARSAGADLVLFPEMSLTGFSMNITFTGEKDRESVQVMSEATKRIGIAVGFGWTALTDVCRGANAGIGVACEGEMDIAECMRGENHYTVINAQGEILSDYVKMHPFSYSGEDRYFEKGNAPAHFTLDGISFSNFICYDLRFPEIFQCVSGRAHVIIVAADWPAGRSEHWKCLLRARAIENQCYILGVNTVGNQNGLYYSGDSCVVLPDGTVAELLSDEEGLLLYELVDDVEGYRTGFPVKRDRRTDLYVELYGKD